MRSALLLLFCGLLAGTLSATSACSGDDEAGTFGVGGSGTSTNTNDGFGGGDSCPTDTCPSACQAPQTCCNGACVDLTSDLNNCGACCKKCPNQFTACVSSDCE